MSHDLAFMLWSRVSSKSGRVSLSGPGVEHRGGDQSL